MRAPGRTSEACKLCRTPYMSQGTATGFKDELHLTILGGCVRQAGRPVRMAGSISWRLEWNRTSDSADAKFGFNPKRCHRGDMGAEGPNPRQ